MAVDAVNGSSRDPEESLLAWFLGPKSENANFMEELVLAVLRDYAHWRRNYFPADKALLTRSSQRALDPVYDGLGAKVTDMMAELRRNFPFYSPRYIGHQLSETTIASIVGHFAGTLFNPNNVTPEAAPVTVDWELDACSALLKMIGFQPAPDPVRSEDERSKYTTRLKAGFGWAHITSGGTLANIEALWAARAVTYFPLAARDVAQELGLQLLVKLPSHNERDRTDAHVDVAAPDLDEYRLLLLKPNEKIYLLAKLVDAVAHKENLAPPEAASRTTALLRACRRSPSSSLATLAADHPPVIFAPVTAHYSVEKAADLLGLGRANVVRVATDAMFRMDPDDLERKLRKCLRERRVPLAVVGVLGTTEEGAIDPIHRIADVRSRLEQEENTSFWLHVDGAWGGYFRCLMNLTGRNRLEIVAERLSVRLDIPFDGDPVAWAAQVAAALASILPTVPRDPERHRLHELVVALGAAADNEERLRCLRAALMYPAARADDAGTSPDDPTLGPHGLGWRTYQLADRDFEPNLDDWVTLTQRHVSDTLAMAYGKYRRTLALKYGDREVCSALLAVPRAESVTVDPHKMGYVGYPCGVVAFQNDRVRHFLMQNAPYITAARHSALVHQPPRHSDELADAAGQQRVSIDAFAPFTLEGSRPGASAVALWLSTEITQPNLDGHGRLIRASALAARELYEWLLHWEDIAQQNQLDPEYDLLPYTPGPPDTNLVIFAVKKKTSSTVADLNTVTKAVYDAFTIQPELGDRDYSYSQPFFLSQTTFEAAAYPYSAVEPFLARAGVRSPKRDYTEHGLHVLRASVMNPYIVEMRRKGTQHVFREFVTEFHTAASDAVRHVGNPARGVARASDR